MSDIQPTEADMGETHDIDCRCRECGERRFRERMSVPTKADREEAYAIRELQANDGITIWPEFVMDVDEAAKRLSRIRSDSVKAERSHVVELRLVIKYAIEKDAEDGYTMHPDIVERLQTALDDTDVLSDDQEANR